MEWSEANDHESHAGRPSVPPRRRLDSVASVFLILACGAVLWREVVVPVLTRRRAEVRLPDQPQSLEHAPVLGDVTARIGLIVHSDFQCPYCARFASDYLPSLKQKYTTTGTMFVAFRHLPIGSAHPLALDAARAADCADEQGMFWPAHDAIFGMRARLDARNLFESVAAVGVNRDQWLRCVSLPPSDRIMSDMALGRELRISGTPFLLLGHRDGKTLIADRMFKGLPKLEVLTRAVDALAGQPPR